MRRDRALRLDPRRLAACDDPTQPAEPIAHVAADQRGAPSSSSSPSAISARSAATSAGANGINEQGEVVGVARLPSGEERAFLWRAGQGMRSLGTLGGSNSRARGINDRSEVVRLQRDSTLAPT